MEGGVEDTDVETVATVHLALWELNSFHQLYLI